MPERKKFFDACADEWDKEFTAEDLEVLSYLIDSFKIRKDSRIVDLGCGTGVMFDMLRRKVGSSGVIVGVDFSKRMIRKARQNFPFENVHALDGDAQNLPLKSDSFDYAISFASFAHFKDKQRVMEEVSRVLRRDGLFYIIHLLSSMELKHHHNMVGGPVALDLLPSDHEMMQLFEHGHFLNVRLKDQPGLYLASGVKG